MEKTELSERPGVCVVCGYIGIHYCAGQRQNGTPPSYIGSWEDVNRQMGLKPAAPRTEASQEVKYSDDPEKGVEIARRLLNEELNRMGLGEAESYTVELMMVIEACVHLADTRQASQDNATASTDAALAQK